MPHRLGVGALLSKQSSQIRVRLGETRPATYRYTKGVDRTAAILELFAAMTEVIVGQCIIGFALGGAFKTSSRGAEVLAAEEGDPEMKMSRRRGWRQTNGLPQCPLRSGEIILLEQELAQPEKSPIRRRIAPDLFLE